MTSERARRITPYTTRLQKGGALLDDMRLLVRHWNGSDATEQKLSMVAENILAKRSRMRATDTLNRSFLPRFVNGDPRQAWRIVRALEDRGLPLETLRPVYYWITARSERLLYDYVCEELVSLSQSGQPAVRVEQVIAWIQSRISDQDIEWTPTVTRKVARGLLAALRDFGVLEGGIKKRVAPVYLPVESFAFIAFALHELGPSGAQLVQHPDWRLFLLRPLNVERLLLEANRWRYLSCQVAGQITRIEFPATSLEEMANVIAARAY